MKRIKYVNNGTLELLGYSLEELNNKPISLIVDDAGLENTIQRTATNCF